MGNQQRYRAPDRYWLYNTPTNILVLNSVLTHELSYSLSSRLWEVLEWKPHCFVLPTKISACS